MFNRHNKHYYSQTNLQLTLPVRNQVRFGFNVWCGIINNRLIGPIIFNGSLTGQRYLSFLQQEIEDLIEELPLETTRQMWLQQDGCPSHNTRAVMDYLNEQFNERVIATNGTVRWPARSPDLAPCDTFLWGTVKNKVYGPTYNNVEELQEAVLEAFHSINGNTIRKVINSVQKRCQLCIENNGGLFE